VGVAPRRAVSPDGRVWRVEKIRERPSLAETRKEPFFWASAVVTFLLIAFMVRLVIVDYTLFDSRSLYALAFVVPLALLWLTERTMNLLRPHIRAETDGPPAERVEWKTTHPLGTSRLMDRAVEAIEAGLHDSEPRGLSLLQLEYR
jgi:hypothetical protein